MARRPSIWSLVLVGLTGTVAVVWLVGRSGEESAVKDPAGAGSISLAASDAVTREGEEMPASKPTKASERPAVTEKKIPVAEPVADKPGYVKSPFSGSIIDVRGIPAGGIVADPMYPASEKKHFRVPEMSPEDEAKMKEEEARRELAEETAKANAPVAEVVPGNPRFIISPHTKAGPDNDPYDRVVIDATGLEPGSVIKDPSSTGEEPRYIKIPGGE